MWLLFRRGFLFDSICTKLQAPYRQDQAMLTLEPSAQVRHEGGEIVCSMSLNATGVTFRLKCNSRSEMNGVTKGSTGDSFF